MRQPRFRRAARVVLVALAILLFFLAGGRALSQYYYWPVFPQGEVETSRPRIGRFVSLGRLDSMESMAMWLDGQLVEASFDAASGCVSYVPPAPLAPGPHTVRLVLRIDLDRARLFYDPLDEKWEFTVARETHEPPVEDPEDRAARARANWLLAGAGLEELSYSPELCLAAWHHAAHLAADPAADAHYEDPASLLFTGESSLDRAYRFGYYGLCTTEDVAWFERAEDNVDGWMTTLYHRLPFLDSSLFGYGHATGARTTAVANFGEVPWAQRESGSSSSFLPPRAAWDETGQLVGSPLGDPVPGVEPADQGLPPAFGVVLWPYPGQKEVPTWWPGLETPDPLRFRSDVTGPVGYTVTVSFESEPERLSLTSGTLTGPGGTPVECLSFSPETDGHLSDTVALLPLEPLAPDTTYQAAFAGVVGSEEGDTDYDFSWSFTTGPGQFETSGDASYWLKFDGDKVWCRLEGAAVREGLSVFVGGLPVRDLDVVSRSEFGFRVPAGFGGGPAELVLVSEDGYDEILQDEFPASREGTSAFTETSWKPSEALAAVRALKHSGGTVMVPLSVLESYGAVGHETEATQRVYWVLGDQQVTATLGRPVALVGGRRIVLPLPVQRLGGEVYAPAELVQDLLGSVQAFADTLGHWARAEIEKLAGLGIVSGYGDATFRPESRLTRAAIVKMLIQARFLPNPPSLAPGDTGGFTDVEGHWLVTSGYLGSAVSLGIVIPADFPDGKFRPDQDATREEIAVMVVRCMGLEGEAEGRSTLGSADGRVLIGERVFRDAGLWTRPGHVILAMEREVIRGYAEGDDTYTFRPAAPATRAEAVIMVYRMMGAMGLNLDAGS